jgi:hypothetical protein
MLQHCRKNIQRRDKFQRLGQAITTNDPHWQSAITPHAWRALRSVDKDLRGGPTVMQIDTRPGMIRGNHDMEDGC